MLRPDVPVGPVASHAPRTAAEAVVRADAKDRIRTARWVRQGGIALLGFGGVMLTRWSTWRPYNQSVGVHLHGGAYFTLSFAAIVGASAVVAGPILVVAGQWMLRRAVSAARANPATADIDEFVDD